MDIVPKLNLNKTPKNADNGSLIFAKNIIVDDTGSYITNEPGFKEAFQVKYTGEFIVGVIPCSDEIVIFTYVDNTKSSYNNTSHIYRLKDNGVKTEIASNWAWQGGTISGTYTYNYKGELIIAVSEYDALGNKKIPLKSWNLNTCSTLDGFTYNIEEEIPKFTVDYDITENGNLVCGVYTFFIRFELDNFNYTKWFQITDDIIIINMMGKEAPVHNYITSSGHETLDTTSFDNFKINTNNISDKNITLTIDYLDECKFYKYQIGYILKRNEEVLGRIENSYSINTTTININSNVYKEEIAIDEFLKTPSQYYNVKNVINYNNRLYIANYEEYDNELIKPSSVKDISYTSKSPESYTGTSITKTFYDITFNYKSTKPGDSSVLNLYIPNVDTYKEDGNTYISYPKAIIQKLYETMYIRVDDLQNNWYSGEPQYWRADEFPVTHPVDGKKVSLAEFIVSSKNGTGLHPSDYANLQTINKIKINNDNTLTFYTNGGSVYLNEITMGVDNVYYNLYIYKNASTSHINQTSSYLYRRPKSKRWINPNTSRQTSDMQINVTVKKVTTTTSKGQISKDNNNRTLIPAETYNIFIHYIRKDKSYTNGFFCKTLQIATTNVSYIMNIVTSNITIPNGYIGYFLSYEDVEETVCFGIVTSRNGNIINFTNTNFIYDDKYIFGSTVYYKTRKENYAWNTSSITKTIHNNNFREPYIESVIDENPTTIANLAFCVLPTKEYNKETKILYRLTEDIFTNNFTPTSYKYSPGFYNEEKVICYDTDCMISPTANSVTNKNGQKIKYEMSLYKDYSYNIYPLNAYYVNNDYSKGTVQLIKPSDGTSLGTFYNQTLGPDILKSFLKLPTCYKSKPSKILTNYNKDYINIFNKTIRRSSVNSDESLTNGFRLFETDDYKNIFENKGNITNLVGLGLYFIVHTEYSIFIFDRTPKLTQKTQLDIPDTFSISYQELIPTNEGFGGLADKNESIVTKNGYIWFDKTNKHIFIFDKGKYSILSKDINNFLKRLNINNIVFGEDIDRNRLIISIYLKDTYEDIINEEIVNEQGNIETIEKTYTRNKVITISYNFNTNTFISLHDYSISDNYKTYKKSYFFNKFKDRTRLYMFDESSNSFYNLYNNNDLFTQYIKEVES